MSKIDYKSKTFKARVLALVVASVIALAAFLPGISRAQVPSVPPPYNVELGALITNSARAPATVTSSVQQNLAYLGVVCTFNQTAVVGSSSTTFGIQFLDPASGQWQTLVTSAAVTTALNTPSSIWVYPGITAATNVSLSQHLPRNWRVTQTNAGASTSTTGTVGCTYLK